MVKKSKSTRRPKFRPTAIFDPPVYRIKHREYNPEPILDCPVLSDSEISEFKKVFEWQQWKKDEAHYNAMLEKDERRKNLIAR